tara:strand:+ start:2159 stop:2425 length:267 start_codon:yes stop_codon:yes gene_type:complete
MQYYLLTKENAEVIINIIADRLKWKDANEIMAIIKDLKPVRITDGEEESSEEKADFTNKFSGTGNRNESKERSDANGQSNPNLGVPVY